MRSNTFIIAALFVAQIPIVLMASVELDGATWPVQTILKNNTSFDYIVVGAGTAGCVVGARLVKSENSVLILEAGDDPPINALLPALFVTLPKTKYDYDYMSAFDPFAASSQGDYTTLTSGKMLGGSASLNHLVHVRGCPCDFDCWACITGDNSWSYDKLLPYFIKSERVEDEEIVNANPGYHGTDGPTGLTRQTSDEALEYLKSFAEAGEPTILDLNANISLGYTQPQFTIADQLRQTPAYSYLKKATLHLNLHVSKNTRVTKLLFENNVAIGVEAVYKGKTYTLRANKEVILSAGVYNTPQILMLSGIGPKDHLKEMDIEVKANLPVGDNFIEQVSTMVVYKTKKYKLPVPAPSDIASTPSKIPFPVIIGSVALNKSDICPDYQTFNFVLPHDTPFITVTCHNTFWFRKDICGRLKKELKGRDALYTILTNVVPKSRGTIRLKSTNPFDDPLITTGFLTDKEDLENMVTFIKDFIKVGKTTFFNEIGAKLINMNIPECKHKEPRSDDFWRCYVKNLAISPYHPVGTCAMGSVVNSNLEVIGFKRLRIVDASIMPINPKAAPNPAVIAVAEKAVDIIKSTPYF